MADDIMTYISGDDTSELAKAKAEAAYALGALERELEVKDALVKALREIITSPSYLAADIAIEALDLVGGQEK